MRPFLTKLLLAGLVAASSVLAPSTAAAIDPGKTSQSLTPHEILRKRIDIAGRQRLLTVRLATAGCFLSAGVDTARQSQILTETIEIYRITLQALRQGNGPMRIPEERNPDVLAALEAAEKEFTRAQPELTRWTSSPPSAEELRAFMPQSSAMLRSARAVVAALTANQNLTPVQAKLARAVDIAGRQRMFAQRAVKEICLGSLPGEIYADRVARHHSVATLIAAFETNARSLAEGNEMIRLVAAPSQETLWGVEASTRAWDAMRLDLREAIASPQLTADQLQHLSDTFEHLLPILDDTVWYYTNF